MATFTNLGKTSIDIIYLVSETLDNYLVGSASDETLVTNDGIRWSNITKN